MESSDTGGAPVSFVRQMLRNNMLLLTVLIALSGAVYLVVGLYVLMGR